MPAVLLMRISASARRFVKETSVDSEVSRGNLKHGCSEGHAAYDRAAPLVYKRRAGIADKIARLYRSSGNLDPREEDPSSEHRG